MPAIINDISNLQRVEQLIGLNIEERFSSTFDTDDTHMSSAMTLGNITSQDTGHFRFYYGETEINQYVYVFGSFILYPAMYTETMIVKLYIFY